MALTVKQLIEKLEQVENKLGEIYIETYDSLLSVDRIFLDKIEDDIIMVSDIGSEHCDCDVCKEVETEL